jgi:hypothetical protein
MTSVVESIRANRARYGEKSNIQLTRFEQLLNAERHTIERAVVAQANADGCQVIIGDGDWEVNKLLKSWYHKTLVSDHDANQLFAAWVRKLEWGPNITTRVELAYGLLIIRWRPS